MSTRNKTRLIVFLCPYPAGNAPGQRFRFEQYLDVLESNGYRYKQLPFLGESTKNILYKKGYLINKVLGVCAGFLRRMMHLLACVHADFVFIHREASPIGPPIFEWLIARALRKRIIYDFDDAIWIPRISRANRVAGWLKMPSKVQILCRWAWKVSAGNRYLCDNAIRFRDGNAEGVVLNPTTIDTENLHNRTKDQNSPGLVIGWTGTHSTLEYLDPLVPVIAELEREFTFRFHVICDVNPNYTLKSFRYIKWNRDTEIDDLLTFNIGLMPLTDDPWSEGKCGFKALQYMALGIPPVVSPVGVNKKIVEEGIDGCFASVGVEWVNKLKALTRDPELRAAMGIAGHQKVVRGYSRSSNAQTYLNLFH